MCCDSTQPCSSVGWGKLTMTPVVVLTARTAGGVGAQSVQVYITVTAFMSTGSATDSIYVYIYIYYTYIPILYVYHIYITHRAHVHGVGHRLQVDQIIT